MARILLEEVGGRAVGREGFAEGQRSFSKAGPKSAGYHDSFGRMTIVLASGGPLRLVHGAQRILGLQSLSVIYKDDVAPRDANVLDKLAIRPDGGDAEREG
jgi:hypothetical protein